MIEANELAVAFGGRLTKRLADIRAAITSGAIQDWAEYRFAIGRLQGLQEAEQILRDCLAPRDRPRSPDYDA